MKRTFLLRSVFLLLTGMLASFPVCAEEDKAFEDLTSAAPTPNVNESEIISIFSDHFQTQKGVAIKATTIMSASEVQAEIKPGTTPEALSRGNKSGVELDLI